MKCLICTFYLIAGVLAIGTNVFGQPAAPSNLTAIAVSINQIALSWQHDATTEDKFEIERKIGAANAYSVIGTVVAANTTIYSDFGLAAGTIYFYRMRAFNDDGYSVYSNEANATTSNPAPALTSIAPIIGNRLQTLDVIFTGTNFINGVTSVNVGSGIKVNSTTISSSTSLTANLTIAAIAATGVRNFSVTNSAPGSGTSANQTFFTVNNPAPALTSFAPASGNRSQTLDVVFTGTNFIDGVSVVGHSSGTILTINSSVVNSATQITANITISPIAPPGLYNVFVTNSGPGGGTSANQTFFTVNNPAPTLTSLSPTNGNRLQTLEVIFTGTNFINGVTSVNVGSGLTINSTVVNSSTSLTANLTIGADAATGQRNFFVTNSAPDGGTSSNQVFFTVNNPAPTFTNLSPTNGNRLQTLNVVLTGTNFIDGISSVSFGADITVNSITINSATRITANITIGSEAVFGARNVSVANTGPGGGTSAIQTFTIGNNPVPTLTSIAPMSGNRLQTLDVVFTGTNFISGVTSVNVGTGITVNSTTVNSSTSLTANLTITAGAATGARNFSVTNSAPGGGTSANQTFTVSNNNNPVPTLTSIAPNNGKRLQTFEVVFTGTNFIDGVSAVNVGAGITVNSITVNSATSLTANLTITTAAVTGARNFSVTTNGQTSGNRTFTVNNPRPTLANPSPNNGKRLQTLKVIFKGTNFLSGVSTVNVGAGIMINSTTVNDSTSLTANLTITAAAATGARSFFVTNSGPGGGVSGNRTFTVNNPIPTLTSLSPNNGKRAQTFDVIFTGTNFISGVTSVNVGPGITVNSTTVNDSTRLTANFTIAAAAATGAMSFSVTNGGPGGGTSGNRTFTVNNPAPTLTSLSPTSGNRLQTLAVVFTGTNFISGITAVSTGTGMTINSITVTSPTSLTANLTITATAATGARNFSVTNSAPGGGTSANQLFTVKNPAPTLTNVSPPNGSRLQTLEVVLGGTKFINGVSSVNLGAGITVNSMLVNSATQMTVNITIGANAALGPRNVTVTNASPGGGVATLPNGFTVGSNPAPALTNLAPANGNRLQTLDVILTGTNFISGVTTVNVGPGIRINSTAVNSATRLTMNLTITAGAATGGRNFSVTNSEPGGGTSTNRTFTVNNPSPTLASLSPATGRRLQTLDVILKGTNFIDGVSAVDFGAGIVVNSTTVNSASQITVKVTIGADAALGAREVAVTNALPGGGTTTLSNGFTVGSNPAPTLASIAPISGNRLQTLEVVFTGTNFINGITTVNAGNGITVNSTMVNPANSGTTSLTANLTITAAATSGARSFSVSNSAPGGGTSVNRTFTVNNPGPTLTGVSPTNANRLQTLEVIFTGTNFISGVSSVNFGAGIAVNTITVDSPTQITANITINSTAALGARNASVTNAPPGGGTAMLTNGFIIGSNPAPTLTSISPTSGNRLQRLEVILLGTNFISGVSSVSFGADITVNSITVYSPTQITANITINSNAAPGARHVAITNAAPGGGTATLTNGFTVEGNPAPTLISVAPANGNRLETLEVIFTGTNFIDGITSVNAGSGIMVNSTTINNSTNLTANLIIAPEAAAGARNFSVNNSGPGGGTSASQTFTVNNPAPTLAGISPTTGNRLQTLDVVFTGTNFISGVTSINAGSDITINSTTVNSSTSLTANVMIAAGAATGARSFSVTNSGPGGGTSANQLFTVNELPPIPPTSLLAEAMSMSQINLRWTDNSNNEAGFKIVRRVGINEMIFTVGPNVQSYQDDEMSRGTVASYQALAYNAGGDSPPSNLANETTATGVRGDVTRDFKIDASDVDFAIRVILQNPMRRVTYLDSMTADTNLDGKINVIDAVDIVNESLKSLLAATASRQENGDDAVGGELRLGAAEIIVGATIELPLTISAAEPVTALQLKIRGDSRALALGDVVLSSGNHGMTLTTARGPDQLAVLIYSPSGDCLKPGTRELLQLALQAKAADFANAGLQIESALLIGKSGKPLAVRICNDAANLKINLPDKFILGQNYPNPFDTGAANPQTEIVYTLPTAGAVKLAVYDILGHEVAILANVWQTPGVKKAHWNGRDRQGKRVTAGIYFYRLEAGDFVAKQKMVLK